MYRKREIRERKVEIDFFLCSVCLIKYHIIQVFPKKVILGVFITLGLHPRARR